MHSLSLSCCTIASIDCLSCDAAEFPNTIICVKRGKALAPTSLHSSRTPNLDFTENGDGSKELDGVEEKAETAGELPRSVGASSIPSPLTFIAPTRSICCGTSVRNYVGTNFCRHYVVNTCLQIWSPGVPGLLFHMFNTIDEMLTKFDIIRQFIMRRVFDKFR